VHRPPAATATAAEPVAEAISSSGCAPLTDCAPRPASGALTKTGGFLCGFTHTLQPYIGCRFGCAYCYVQGLQVHRFHQPPLAWGAYVHPRTGIAERLRAELGRLQRKGVLEQVRIFMSSATDPYQPAERTWRLARACLEALRVQRPGLLVVQTRSPLVRDDFALLRDLGDAAWLSVTLETDVDDVRRAVTPACPSVGQRIALIRDAQSAGLHVQIAVSPCLPFSSVERFADLLEELAGETGRVVVDSYVAGDGQGGRRTAATTIPALHAAHAWPEWRDDAAPRALLAAVAARLGNRAGWSQAGFAALAEARTGDGAPPPHQGAQ
jgi:DNA repair photolyase